MALTIQISNSGQWEQIKIIGAIDEDAEVHLNHAKDKLGQNIIFNFKEVSSVNSCGVRAWINFLRDVEHGREIHFVNCTPEIVSQINMIPNFKSNAIIDSIFADYSCDSCGHHKMVLFEAGKNMPSAPGSEMEPVKCDQCGEDMEMDELEDEFFAFLDVA